MAMDDFVFKLPTRVVFARGGLDQVGAEAARLGRRILLVYGCDHLKKSGNYQRVYNALETAGLTWRELAGIKANPGLAEVRRGIALVREHNLEAVAAIGGGSVLDSAKAVAAGACVRHDIKLFFRGKKSIRRTLPLLCLPTLAGSGSELNSGMVLTDEERGGKLGIGNRHLFPATTILDPELTLAVPWPQTLFGAVDAICHLGEFFLTDRQSDHRLQDRLATGLIRTIMESCEKLQRHPADYPARAALLWASSLALSGLNRAGRGRVEFPLHLLSHAVASRHDRPHGAILAALWPAWLEQETAGNRQRVEALNGAIFPPTPPIPVSAGADWQRWLQTMGAALGLRELGINLNENEITAITAAATPQARLWRLHCDPRQFRRILTSA